MDAKINLFLRTLFPDDGEYLAVAEYFSSIQGGDYVRFNTSLQRYAPLFTPAEHKAAISLADSAFRRSLTNRRYCPTRPSKRTGENPGDPALF